jgi:general secretion pathway protein F
MAQFFYQATDAGGKLVEGNIEASDHKTAVQKIRKLNIFPVAVSTEKPKKRLPFKLQIPTFNFFAPISQKELMGITQQLATLLDSGLTLDRSLSTLSQLMEKEKTREILSVIQERVHAGSAFSAALAEYPTAFSRLYVNMIRAGETGGVLGSVLNRLADFLEKSEDMKNNIRSAMIYPLILILVGGGAVIVLMTVVIPKLATIFTDLGHGLPLPTQILLATSHFFSAWWWALLVGIITLFGVFKWYLSTEKGKYRWDSVLLKLPLFGALIRKIEVSRFSRTISTLIKSGVPVLKALAITAGILNNSVITRAMHRLHDSLKGGKGMAEPLAKLAVFPPLAVRMITVGEETGELDEMLAKISNIYDKEVERAVKQLVSLIEPLLILFMAGIIGFIVISMLLAIFSINELPL